MISYATACRVLSLCAFLFLASASAVHSQVTALPPWTASVSLGGGFAHVTLGRDTALQSSTPVLLQADGSVRVSSRFFVGGELTVMPYALVGDCIPGFTVCASAVRFHSLDATTTYSFTDSIRSGIPTVIVGTGASLFPSTESRGTDSRLRIRVPATTVANLMFGLDFPMWVRKRGGVLVELRTAFLPNSPGGNITVWSLRLGYRMWSRPKQGRRDALCVPAPVGACRV